MDACISSKVRPLVSATSFATKTTAAPATAEKMKNVPAVAQMICYCSED